MADNTTLSTGTGGDVIATDDIGGVKFQRVKLVEGADNTNDGDISSANPLPVETPNKIASGALGALNAEVSVSCQGIAGASWEIDTGTLVGTVVFEATDDDTNWFAVEAIRIAGGIITSTATFADRGHFTSVSYSQIKLRVSAYTSGTSNARIEASTGGAITRLGQAIPTGDNTIGRVKITDGTDVVLVTAGGLLQVDGSGATQPVSGTVNIGTFPDNEPFNLSQVGGTATVTGGVAGLLAVGGAAAHASPASGNPVYVGGRASTALPTDVGADGDAAAFWTNRNGATVVAVSPHIGLNSDPYNLLHEAAQYTTTQTSTVLIAGGASEKIVVTKVQIQVGGTTAGTLQLYFGTAAFSRGTSRSIFDGEFAPSSTLKPGVVMDGPFISGTNGDDLLVTTSAAINPLTIAVWYYLVV